MKNAEMSEVPNVVRWFLQRNEGMVFMDHYLHQGSIPEGVVLAKTEQEAWLKLKGIATST